MTGRRKKLSWGKWWLVAAAVLILAMQSSMAAFAVGTSGSHASSAAASAGSSSTGSGSPAGSTSSNAGSSAAASGSGTVMNYPDVSSGHWAAGAIAKLSLLGVIHGFTDGSFQPSASINKEQAVVMVVQFAGLGSKVDPTSKPVLPLFADPYARPYVDVAIQNNLIQPNEELADAVSSGNSSAWGTSPASREWVAKLIVRALGKQSDAGQAAGQSTSFTDDSAISSTDKPYVKVAANLKIIAGLPDGSFKPAGSVTRAEMAVMLSQAEPLLSVHSSLIATGTLLDTSNQQVQIQQADGSKESYPLASSALFYETGNTKAIQLSDIKPYAKVSVVHPNGTVEYLEVLDNQPQYLIVTGQLKSLDTANQQLTVTVGGTDKTYPYADTVAVTDTTGAGMRLSDLKAGKYVKLQIDDFTSAATVKSIALVSASDAAAAGGNGSDGSNTSGTNGSDSGGSGASGSSAGSTGTGGTGAGSSDNSGSSSSNNGSSTDASASATTTVQGKVEAVDAVARQVVVMNTATGQLQTLTLPASVNVAYQSSTISLASLQAGDTVSVRLVNNAVIAFTLTARNTLVVDGKVETINNQVLYIQRSDDGSHVGYDIGSSTQVTIDGMSHATINDLLAGDHVELTLSDAHTVQAIVVKNRNIHTGIGYTIRDYDDSTDQLVLKTPKGALTVFQLTDQSHLQNLSGDVSLSNFSQQFPTGQRVDVMYTSDQSTNQVLTLRVAQYYEGTISDIDTTNKQISIDTSDFGTVTLPYTTPLAIDMFNKTNEQLTDLGIGQQVRLNLNPTTNAVNILSVQQYTVADITSITSGNLTVQTPTGYSYNFYLSNTPVVSSDGTALDYSNLQTGENIVLNVTGSTLNGIVVPDTFNGTVTSVDTADKQFTVTSFGGSAKTFTAGPQLTVSKGGDTYSVLNSLTTGDRVTVVEEAKTNNHLVIVLTPLTKTFFKYLPDSNSVQFYHGVNDASQYIYKLADQVNLHQGTKSIPISSFQNNDSVIIYVMNGQIVDMERLTN